MTNTKIKNRLEKIAKIENEIKALENEKQKLRAEIIDGRDSLNIECAAFICRYNLVESTRIDSKKLKNDLPDVWSLYAVTSTSKRFSYKRRFKAMKNDLDENMQTALTFYLNGFNYSIRRKDNYLILTMDAAYPYLCKFRYISFTRDGRVLHVSTPRREYWSPRYFAKYQPLINAALQAINDFNS